jgi:hypothetical protein
MLSRNAAEMKRSFYGQAIYRLEWGRIRINSSCFKGLRVFVKLWVGDVKKWRYNKL